MKYSPNRTYLGEAKNKHPGLVRQGPGRVVCHFTTYQFPQLAAARVQQGQGTSPEFDAIKWKQWYKFLIR